MIDYLIVGAGLYGATCARELTDKGYKCLVIDKRKHIGGNCYTENVDGINVHKYGPHIFHTSDEQVWRYVNSFTEFNNFIYRPKVSYRDRMYSFPINLLTLHQVYPDVTTPSQAKIQLDIETSKYKEEPPTNMEEYCLSTIGKDLYEIFIKGYTHKQWGRSPRELPISIAKRLPVRLDFNDNYFNDKYQGIPIGGYTQMIERMLEGIEVSLGHDLFYDAAPHHKNMIYTGAVDEFFDYRFGKLEYRSLEFSQQRLEVEDYQGNAVINYTDYYVSHTRVTEHKHFEGTQTPYTIITREYPTDKGDPYYPINDSENNKRYAQYKELMAELPNTHFGGRLAEYKYYNMDQVIKSALDFCEKI